jgi:hypothetical protein
LQGKASAFTRQDKASTLQGKANPLAKQGKASKVSLQRKGEERLVLLQGKACAFTWHGK